MSVTRNKRSRSAYINSFKKIVESTLKELYENYTPEQLVDLNSSLTLLQEKFKKISNIHDNILNEIEEENIDEEISKQTDFEEYACKQIGILKTFIEKCTADTISASISNISEDHSSMATKNVKLPRIELKKYNGNPLLWKSFIDTFNSAVHKNSSLSDVEKLNYLMNLLTGPAEVVLV